MHRGLPEQWTCSINEARVSLNSYIKNALFRTAFQHSRFRTASLKFQHRTAQKFTYYTFCVELNCKLKIPVPTNSIESLKIIQNTDVAMQNHLSSLLSYQLCEGTIHHLCQFFNAGIHKKGSGSDVSHKSSKTFRQVHVTLQPSDCHHLWLVPVHTAR